MKIWDKLYLPHRYDMEKYKILMVDDHQIFLRGIKFVIEQYSKQFEVIDCVHSATEAKELLKSKDYDILITDYQMPEMSGMELIQIAKSVLPEIKTIVLSMHDEPNVIKEILQQGVNGFVLKNDTHDSLGEALQYVINGKQYLSQDITSFLIHHSTEKQEGNVLTPREEEILRLIAKEYSSKQIAEILFISEKTVETHRKNILKKTKSNSVVGLINYAHKHDMV